MPRKATPVITVTIKRTSLKEGSRSTAIRTRRC
jgi:hypothetical protein